MTAFKLSLQIKLLLGFIFTALFIIVGLGWESFRSARKTIKALNFQHLKTIRETKKFEIEGYFKDIHSHCLFMAEMPMIVEAMEQFKQAFNEIQADDETLKKYTADLKKFYENEFLPKLNETVPTKKLEDVFPNDPKTIILQTLYLAYNPNPLEKKYEYDEADDGSSYSKLHVKYHDILSRYIKRFGFLNFYLVDIDTGYVTFNISKEIDFATNLINGPLQDTSLAQLFDTIKKTNDKSFSHLTDFTFYDPSYGMPVAFIGAPIYHEDTKIGCLIFQLPINTINNIMTYDKRWREVGLGDTGETYIIGPGKLMRTIARPFVEDQQTYLNKLRKLHVPGDIIDKMQIYKSTILLQEVAGTAGKDVVKGDTDTIIGHDYLNEISLSSYTPLAIQDVQWSILAEIDLMEEFAPIKALAWRTIILAIIMLTLVIIGALIFIRFIMRPLEQITNHLTQPMVGFKEKMPVTSNDEIGTIAQAYNALSEKIAHMLYNVQKVDNALAQSLKQVAHKIQLCLESFHVKESLTVSEKKALLENHLQELALLHKQCQDLEKQLHDVLDRIDI